VASALLLAGGCGSPERKVAGQMNNLRALWQTNLTEQTVLAEKVLDWPSAFQLMHDRNLKLRQAATEITNAQESVTQVYKDLIPTLNLRAGATKRFVDFGHFAPNDVTFSADSFFNVPGVANFGARLYAAQLYLLRAKAAYQLSEREQAIELYRLFFTAEELRDQERRVQMQRATATAMQQVDPFTGKLRETEVETHDLSLSRDVKTFQDRACEILGSREAMWMFSTNGLPDLRYQEIPLPLDDTNRIAQVQLKLVAVELEFARAQLFGLKLQYWPELNIFVSGPPIYQRSFGTDVFWDARQLQASADLFWNIDTRGNLTRTIHQVKRQQDLQRERYKQESLTLMNRLVFTPHLIQNVQKQLHRVEDQLAVLLLVPPAQNYTAFEKYIYDYRSLTQQQLQLKRDLSELNTVFWFVDEDAWRNQNQNATPNT